MRESWHHPGLQVLSTTLGRTQATAPARIRSPSRATGSASPRTRLRTRARRAVHRRQSTKAAVSMRRSHEPHTLASDVFEVAGAAYLVWNDAYAGDCMLMGTLMTLCSPHGARLRATHCACCGCRNACNVPCASAADSDLTSLERGTACVRVRPRASQCVGRGNVGKRNGVGAHLKMAGDCPSELVRRGVPLDA